MKKFLQLALTLVVAFSFVTGVNAATKQDIIDHAKSTSINGKYVQTKYINQLKDYLDGKTVSSEGAQQIIDDFDKVAALMRAAGVDDATKLSKADRNVAFGYAKDAASVLGITATYKNGKVYLSDAAGELAPVEVSTILRKTGTDYTVYVAVSGLALAVIAVAGYRKLKGNA